MSVCSHLTHHFPTLRVKVILVINSNKYINKYINEYINKYINKHVCVYFCYFVSILGCNISHENTQKLSMRKFTSRQPKTGVETIVETGHV